MSKKILVFLMAWCWTLQPNLAEEAQNSGIQQSSDLLVVLLFDDKCKEWCHLVRPIVKELKTEYNSRVSFVEIDVSPKLLKDSKKQAKELGVLGFLEDFADFVPYVGLFRKRKLIKELPGPKDKGVYTNAIDKALKQ